VKGGTTGCGIVRSLRLSKQCTYSVQESMFIVKTFYKTSNFVAVQREFQRKFNRWQAPARSAISCLV